MIAVVARTLSDVSPWRPQPAGATPGGEGTNYVYRPTTDLRTIIIGLIQAFILSISTNYMPIIHNRLIYEFEFDDRSCARPLLRPAKSFG